MDNNNLMDRVHTNKVSLMKMQFPPLLSRPGKLIEPLSKPMLILLTIALLVLIGAGDYATGIEYTFLPFYFIPIALASWYISRRAGYFTALSSAIIWTIVDYFGRASITVVLATWNILIQYTLFVVFATIVSRIKEIMNEYRQVNTQLQQALNEVKQLSGLLPICSWCKRIRDERGEWHQIEAFIADHSEADFSHGICPDCLQKNFPGRKPAQ